MANDPCPVLSAAGHDETGGLPPSLAEGVVTDLDALMSAFPASVQTWTRGRTTAMPRGAAGHWSPVMITTYASADVNVFVEVNDLVHVCTCALGMGGTLRASERARSGGEDTTVHGFPALRIATPPQRLVWVNDRCTLRIVGSAQDAPVDAIADAIDWSVLAGACPAR